MTIIIKNLLSRLEQDIDEEKHFIITYRKEGLGFFSKADSKQLRINLMLSEKERKSAFFISLRNYILDRMEPYSNLFNAAHRFKKLSLANALLNLLRASQDNLKLADFMVLYNEAADLEGPSILDYGSSNRLPGGGLGKLFISIRETLDPEFKKAYKLYLEHSQIMGLAIGGASLNYSSFSNIQSDKFIRG